MGWPQYTYLGLTCAGLGLTLAKHGEPRTGKHNFWVTSISTALIGGILYAGGFFS